MFTVKKIIRFFKTRKPAKAYNLLAATYDTQANNLVMLLDKKVTETLLQNIELKNKIVVDFGCGTGRHWELLYQMKVKEIIGVDVSKNMLRILKTKFPEATTYLIENQRCKSIEDAYCDVILSTLTLGYLKNLSGIFKEWDRILKKGSFIVLTDLHPSSLNQGAERVFSINSKLIRVKNYVYSIEEIRLMANQFYWKELAFSEIKIDEDLKPFYEKENALEDYQKFYQVPVIYGIAFIKA